MSTFWADFIAVLVVLAGAIALGVGLNVLIYGRDTEDDDGR
jgi:hypothetical protein